MTPGRFLTRSAPFRVEILSLPYSFFAFAAMANPPYLVVYQFYCTDEARQGYGKKIITTRYADGSVEVQDFGRGCPVDYNPKEQRYNWELVFCELYAGGKYDNNAGNSAYEYSLGLNGLGACATQYSSEYMEVRSFDGTHVHSICFKKGEPVTELQTQELTKNEPKITPGRLRTRSAPFRALML